MFCTYVLKNHNGRIYIGQTDNLTGRLKRHNDGRERSTKGHGPFELIYKEEFDSRSEATKRERELKSGQGRQWIKNGLLSKNQKAV